MIDSQLSRSQKKKKQLELVPRTAFESYPNPKNSTFGPQKANMTPKLGQHLKQVFKGA